MFVALSILIQQLRTERKLDVCTVARKLRSQRLGMLQTFVSSLLPDIVNETINRQAVNSSNPLFRPSMSSCTELSSTMLIFTISLRVSVMEPPDKTLARRLLQLSARLVHPLLPPQNGTHRPVPRTAPCRTDR